MQQSRRLSIRCGQLISTSCIALSGCTSTASIPKLLDWLIGFLAISAGAGQLLNSTARDTRTRRNFQELKLHEVKESVVLGWCEISRSPCQYAGANLVQVHKNLDINPAGCDVFVQKLIATLDRFRVNVCEKMISCSYSTQ